MDYKEGDLVQIIDVDSIENGSDFWKNGDIRPIIRVTNRNTLWVQVNGDPKFVWFVDSDELHAIRKVKKVTKESYTADYLELTQVAVNVSIKVEQMVTELERQGAINRALDSGNKELFMQLTSKELSI